MLRWQRDIITAKLTDFNKDVNVSVQLLAVLTEKGLLSEEESQRLEHSSLIKIEKAASLVRTLQTKLNGFDIFIEALCHLEVKQYGPAKLLLEGRSEYYKTSAEPKPLLPFLDSATVQRLQEAYIPAHILPVPTNFAQENTNCQESPSPMDQLNG
ncbi:hypothetical protein Ocin01_16190 [Orchesella cincta]|uniref:CARD domain-containing protein n=1 Tax=Orchesella cincta TaxID=48709 RepID=A0A1D2MC56_ORCCI|nr:hypothetical protein Ocin01_16190 [Orchesella cincta]